MDQKQRVLGTLLGEGADRFPFFDLEPDEETIEKWHREGLPRETSVAEFFNLEIHYSVGLTIRSYLISRKLLIWLLTHLLLPGTIIPMTLPSTGRTLLSSVRAS